jgi:hypothetical protein
MPRRSANHALLALACLISAASLACAPWISPGLVYGTYAAVYPYGTETLVLHRDGRCVQTIALANQPPMVVNGRWRFLLNRTKLQLRGILNPDDGAGHLSKTWRAPGERVLTARIIWFRVILGSEQPFPLEKQHWLLGDD